ncbi:hypothetical protein [Pseudomonas sp. IT-347P]|uniref:hypothetical protein n=1 Tax=Pseudomonas sp. IT-347P TaxID=3026458 RepID=UPI0039E099A7
MSQTLTATAEVLEILRKRREVKENRISSAASRQKRFEADVEKLIAQVQGWFQPLLTYGVSSTISESLVSCNFGLGEVEIGVKKLEIQGIDEGLVLSVSGVYPGCEQAKNGVFFAECPLFDRVDLVFWPEPISRKYDAAWYVLQKTDATLESPAYQKFDEQLVMTWFKSILTEESGA